MLINCKECNKEYSDKAEACPNCGCPTLSDFEHRLKNNTEYKGTSWLMLLSLKIFKNLPNMKWYFRYLFYLFLGIFLFLVVIFISSIFYIDDLMRKLGGDYYNLIGTIFLIGTVFLPIFLIEKKVLKDIKKLKAESNENGQK